MVVRDVLALVRLIFKLVVGVARLVVIAVSVFDVGRSNIAALKQVFQSIPHKIGLRGSARF